MTTSDAIECPKCHSPMQHVRVGETEIERCARCGGIWLDVFEKDAVLANSSLVSQADPNDARPHTASPKAMSCPRDHWQLIHMVDQRQPHVKFEACKSCGGIFLDAGELTDLSEYTIVERLKSAFKR